MTTAPLPQREPLDVHPELYAETVAVIGWDPFNRVPVQRRDEKGRFVASPKIKEQS